MSKYTEAIESLQWVDQYEISYEMMQTITEALKIADRLEHAKPSVSVGATEPYSWLKNDSKTFNAYWEGVLVGYNQALADIRGDNNDGV